MNPRTLRDLATSRAAQVEKLRRAAQESPAHAGLFEALAAVLESSAAEPFEVTESFRWTPVQAHTVRLADMVIGGRL